MADIRPLDHAFIEGMRKRIELARVVDDCIAHVKDPAKTPMSKTQVQLAIALMKKVMPDLQAVAHSGSIEQPQTREAIIDRIADIHARATSGHAGGGTAGTAPPDGGTPTHH